MTVFMETFTHIIRNQLARCDPIQYKHKTQNWVKDNLLFRLIPTFPFRFVLNKIFMVKDMLLYTFKLLLFKDYCHLIKMIYFL